MDVNEMIFIIVTSAFEEVNPLEIALCYEHQFMRG